MQKIYNDPRKVYQSWLKDDLPHHIAYTNEQMLSMFVRGSIEGLSLLRVVDNLVSPFLWESTLKMTIDGKEFDYTFELSRETGKPIFTVDLDYLKDVCNQQYMEA